MLRKSRFRSVLRVKLGNGTERQQEYYLVLLETRSGKKNLACGTLNIVVISSLVGNSYRPHLSFALAHLREVTPFVAIPALRS